MSQSPKGWDYSVSHCVYPLVLGWSHDLSELHCPWRGMEWNNQCMAEKMMQ